MAIGFLVAGRAEKLFGRKDARCIVIDETSGMLLSFMLIPYDIKFLIAAFALFRILDALKPYPAASFEKIKGSMGIMGDDIIAGLYANVILQVVLRLASLRTS
jgi:phosphatidylglycerophosphatase A